MERVTQSALRDLSQVLDDEIVELASAIPNGSERLTEIFHGTFDIISENGGDSVLRKFDLDTGEFRGSFLNSSFEIIALGLGYNLANGNDVRTNLRAVAKRLWSLPQMAPGFSTGRSTEARLTEFIPLGRQLLAR